MTLLTSTLTLYYVLCVPTFSFNLISVSQLSKSIFCCLIFLDTLCYIQALQPWQMIGLGRAKGNLYLLDTALTEFPSFSFPSFVSNVSCTNNSAVLPASLNYFTSVHDKDQDVHLWHATLGHPSISRKIFLSKCIPQVAIDNKKQFTCNVCPSAKQKRLPFPRANHESKNAFDLIHCDTWGPFSIPTPEGFRYFLTLLDDCTKTTWLYLMRSKSEASLHIPAFFSIFETQFKSKIKCFQSDNAP